MATAEKLAAREAVAPRDTAARASAGRPLDLALSVLGASGA